MIAAVLLYSYQSICSCSWHQGCSHFEGGCLDLAVASPHRKRPHSEDNYSHQSSHLKSLFYSRKGIPPRTLSCWFNGLLFDRGWLLGKIGLFINMGIPSFRSSSSCNFTRWRVLYYLMRLSASKTNMKKNNTFIMVVLPVAINSKTIHIYINTLLREIPSLDTKLTFCWGIL